MMRPIDHKKRRDDLIKAEKLGRLDDALGRTILRMHHMGELDHELAEELDARVLKLEDDLAFDRIDPFTRPVGFDSGDAIGLDSASNPVLVSDELLATHTLLPGASGSGKSHLLLGLLRPKMLADGGLWAGELYKKELRHAALHANRRGASVAIVTRDTLRVNALQLDGVDRGLAETVAADNFCRSFSIGGRGRAIVSAGIHALNEKFLGRGLSPCPVDLWVWVKAAEGLNAQARAAVLDRMTAQFVACGVEPFCWRRGWPALDLKRRKIVFELGGFPEPTKKLVIGSLLMSAMYASIHAGPAGRGGHGGRLLVAFDDALRLLAQDESGDLTPLAELASLVRSLRIQLFFPVQSVSGIPLSLRANLSNIICGRLATSEDLNIIASDMSLPPQARKWVASHLGRGTFLARFGEASDRRPFVLRVPYTPLPPITDACELQHAKSLLDDLPTVLADEYRGWSPYEKAVVAEAAKPAEHGIGAAELALLKAVIANPGLPSGAYAKLAGIGGVRARRFRKDLVGRGYLREHSVATSARGGRPSIILEPLDSAHKAVTSAKERGDA
ncbi:MAG: hypothetical protein ED559_06125 [Phycisphaera sp.]|nr:MAG: hypothetical protein ED559_06125 [Phycisphaera sp.]